MVSVTMGESALARSIEQGIELFIIQAALFDFRLKWSQDLGDSSMRLCFASERLLHKVLQKRRYVLANAGRCAGNLPRLFSTRHCAPRRIRGRWPPVSP